MTDVVSTRAIQETIPKFSLDILHQCQHKNIHLVNLKVYSLQFKTMEIRAIVLVNKDHHICCVNRALGILKIAAKIL